MAVNHVNTCADQFLFDETVLKSINFEESQKRLDINISPSNLGDAYILRPLSSGDYNKDVKQFVSQGYLELLTQLTKVGDITEEMYQRRFKGMKECPNTYYIVVIENKETKKIVAAASLILEQKFIHEIALRGRIEEVVVHSECRGKHFGKVLVETSALLAEILGCYKISLDCKEHLIPYYGKFGFKMEDGIHYLIKRIYN